jgi:hypothetical protein
MTNEGDAALPPARTTRDRRRLLAVVAIGLGVLVAGGILATMALAPTPVAGLGPRAEAIAFFAENGGFTGSETVDEFGRPRWSGTNDDGGTLQLGGPPEAVDVIVFAQPDSEAVRTRVETMLSRYAPPGVAFFRDVLATAEESVRDRTLQLEDRIVRVQALGFGADRVLIVIVDHR